jgi:hypothetical protein
MVRRLEIRVLLAVAVVLIGTWDFRHEVAAVETKAKHQIETEAAWNAFRNGDYKEATRHAADCIDDFFPTAMGMEKKLREKKVLVPVDEVREAERQQIFQNGPLNDVAACWYIRGRAAEYSNDSAEAKKAFQQASRYTYARCYDDKTGKFWSVADAATGRLLIVETYEKQGKQWPAEKEVNHETLTAFAWEAYNKDDYAGVVLFADRCFTNYSTTALRLQAEAQQRKITLPAGAAFTENEKKEIEKNGPLNDVGTCLFIKGRSLQKLERKAEAKAAYEAAAKYSYGRCWDPIGRVYWSPAEASGDRLELMQ